MMPYSRFKQKCSPTVNRNGCILWLARLDKDGYGDFVLNGKMEKAHRAAWIMAFGEIPDGMCVCHHCDERSCVRASHLFLGTHLDNMNDMAAKGRVARGTRVNTAKLSEQQVTEIRSLYANGGVTQRQLGARYGVRYSTIGAITQNRTWRYLLPQTNGAVP